jgi:hypothetical protein
MQFPGRYSPGVAFRRLQPLPVTRIHLDPDLTGFRSEYLLALEYQLLRLLVPECLPPASSK